MGVLVYSDDPAAHLRAAGLPREGLSSIGREAWFEPEASYLRDNAAGMTHRNTLRAILAEPAALARMALDAAEHVGAVQEAWLGSEPAYRVAGQSAAAAGRAAGGEASPRPSFWALLPRGASYFAVCAAVWALSALVFLRRRREAASRPLVTLAVAAWLFATLSVGELLVCILGDGMAAIAKHLFVSSLSFALAAASGTGLAVGYCASLLAGPGARRRGG
jgi:hypothetical protein